MKIINKLLIAIITLTIALSFSLSFNNEVYAAKKTSKVKTSAEKASTNAKKQNTAAEAKVKNDKKTAEIKKLIEDAKKKHPELVAGTGMAHLNRSPSVSFEKGKNGKVNAKIEDSSGIEKIIRTNAKTKNKKEIAGNKQKEQTDLFDEPAKNKEKTIVYTLKDINGLTSKVTCSVTNKGSYDSFNVSIRETFSYSNGYLNIILRDNGGINEGKASVEVIDKNTNKSLGKVTKKNIKIKNPVKYNGKDIYGIYQIDINKLTRDKDKNYFIQVNTTDNNGTAGYRMAKFSLNDTETKTSTETEPKPSVNEPTKNTISESPEKSQKKKQTIATAFDSFTFANKVGEKKLKAKATSKLPLTYSSDNTKVATVNKDGTIKAKGTGSAKITIKQSGNTKWVSTKKVVTVKVASTNTLAQALQPWFNAQKSQYSIEKNVSYRWISNPTVSNSKKGGTCVTYVACSLQRLGFIKPGQFLYMYPKSGKLTATSKKILDNRKTLFEYKYLYKTPNGLKENDIKIGDILCFQSSKQGHIQIYAGKNSKNQLLYNSGGRVRRWTKTSPNYNNKKISAVIRIKTYDVKASCINGKVSGCKTYMAKQDAEITYTPDKGKTLKSLTINGKEIDIKKYPNKYKINNISKDYSIQIVFE